MRKFFPASFERKDYSCCSPIGLGYEPIPYCSGCQIWLAMQYNALLPDLSASRFFFSEDRCLNRCNISFAISQVEDCLELNFKYIDYQTLAHLSYSSCVCLTSVHTARAQHFLSVWVLICASTMEILYQFMPCQYHPSYWYGGKNLFSDWYNFGPQASKV